MLFNTNFNSIFEYYNKYLTELNDIKFTHREIDVISCIVNTRGDKKIAQILAISPRTVSVHVYNVMSKLGCNSKEQIIDFIEKSGKIQILREYYLHLIIRSMFEKQLQTIGGMINKDTIYFACAQHQAGREALKLIKSHLAIANIQQSNKTQDITHAIDIIGAEKQINHKLSTTIILDPEIKDESLQNRKYIDFRSPDQYYISLFELIKNISNKTEIDNIIAEFKAYCESVTKSFTQNNITIKNNNIAKFILQHKVRSIIILLAIICLLTACHIAIKTLIYQQIDVLETQQIIKASLKFPNKRVTILREDIMDKIESRFKKTDDNIKTVVLTGIGGAGKTIAAHLYAQLHSNAQLIWEVNSSSRDSIVLSFEKLAYLLADTTEEKNQVEYIVEEISNQLHKEEHLLHFVAGKFKKSKDWLLIFDNADHVNDIQSFLPLSSNLWGHGKVIITSRDSNILSNGFIDPINIITLSQLTEIEKEKLFDNIMLQNNIDDDQEDKQLLLKMIPPFPLDVTTAAYYIKVNNISYEEYIELIKNQNPDKFSNIQEELVQDIGLYEHSRYNIITSSLQKIIAQDEKFQDLLLMVGLLNNTNIPKKLLVDYTDNITANNFLKSLRHYSLLTEEKKHLDELGAVFSVHHIVQDVIISYLTTEIKLSKNDPKVNKIANKIHEFTSGKTVRYLHPQQMKVYLMHMDVLLSHEDFLTDEAKINIGHLMSNFYRYACDYDNAKNYLHKTLEIASSYYPKDDEKISEILKDLGVIYRDRGEYTKALELLNTSFDMIKIKYDKHHIKYAKYLERLANIHFYLGNSAKNLEYLKHSYNVYLKHYGTQHPDSLLLATSLARMYNETGEYDQAQILFDNNVQQIVDHFGYENFLTSDALLRQGVFYTAIGKHDKSYESLNKALEIRSYCYGEAHYTSAWVMAAIANNYRAMGHYDKAHELYTKAIPIIAEKFGDHHNETALAKANLGISYVKEGKQQNIAKAQKLLEESLKILEECNHYYMFHIFEALCDLHINCINMESNIDQKEQHKLQAKMFLDNSLEIAKKAFPKTSMHTKRLQQKQAMLFDS